MRRQYFSCSLFVQREKNHRIMIKLTKTHLCVYYFNRLKSLLIPPYTHNKYFSVFLKLYELYEEHCGEHTEIVQEKKVLSFCHSF